MRAGWMGTKWQAFGSVLRIFLLSRMAFYVAALAGSSLLPAASNSVSVDVNSNRMLALHWRWDAVHYGSIAVGGYNQYASYPMPGNPPETLHAFFPFQPLLIRLAATLLNGFRTPQALPITAAPWEPLLAGVLVIHAATLLAFWLLFVLVCDETGDAATAERAVLYTAIFPLAFFYAVPYAEPVFLAASVGAFLAARRGYWVRAGVAVAAATTTRPYGVLLLPVLALEIVLAWRRGELQRKVWSRVWLGLLLAPLGLLLFMLHLWQQVGDPLAFIHAQQSDWHREPVFPLTTLWRGFGYLLHPSWSDDPPSYALTVVHTTIVVGFLVILVASLRQWRPTYILYGLLLFAQILAVPWPGQSVMHTLGRSAMMFFPVYITLAGWGRRVAVHQLILLLWLPLFGVLAALYVSWFFVA